MLGGTLTVGRWGLALSCSIIAVNGASITVTMNRPPISCCTYNQLDSMIDRLNERIISPPESHDDPYRAPPMKVKLLKK